ncbi:MAG: transcription-repair coupling factor [Ignavibacteriae bacterium]|nr:transcription-repair coupling factor [Ignavibacteriota bacterium]
MLDAIKKKLFHSPEFKALKQLSGQKALLSGVNGSLISFITEYIHKNVNPKIFFISGDKSTLEIVKDDLSLLSDSKNISIYSAKGAYYEEELAKTLTDLTEDSSYIVLAQTKEITDKIISKEIFQNSVIELKSGEEYPFESLIEKLGNYNFIEKDFVEEVGDFSVRGGIIDIFPESYYTPLRIEFFGDTIESIREFDITTQRSLKQVESVRMGMNLSTSDIFFEEKQEAPKDSTVLDYVSDDTLIIIDEPESTLNELGKTADAILQRNCLFVTSFKSTGHLDVDTDLNIEFDSKPQPDFHSNLKALYGSIAGYLEKDDEIYILCSDDYQAKRIKKLIEDFEDDVVFEKDSEIHHDGTTNVAKNPIKDKFKVVSDSVQSGFVYEKAGLVVFTEHQIFGRYFKQYKKRRKKFRGLSLSQLKELQIGDYIVHRDFGIGIFAGLKKITVGGNEQEVLKLSYADEDTVFLNLNYIHLIRKYSSTEGFVPKLTKLGGGEWDKIKQKTKSKVKDIARDLILLYASRKSQKGFRFNTDTHWQSELEASFMYEDTPDQYKATLDVKEDMESENPMDRLVCGDVGFGKTEVAIRAAFKAVLDNKQVAVLVPTTILAVQHYNTFRDRLSPYAVDVEVLSRFQPRKEQKLILERLEQGKVNIVIATHRLLSKDVMFKDLGLLIIDEEQRFGVKAKERLRTFQPNVDTLTLTATPIPRTLNFSLLGARDLSVINTPPKNRKPIQTEIISRDWEKIAEIIKTELERNGQVYFVNDKIGKLDDIADKIKEYLPLAKIGIAHGQMDSRELEDVVVNFIEKKLNVLVCTKIIESGLDIPNVNTIIINNANMFGLAELYQLRGRVGRSEQQAYAYLISPGGKMTKTAVRRLQAIEEFTDLGSGINLAMRDMEIRGVGNLLGKEQSGFIQQIGFDMFMSVIDEAVAELKGDEFKDLFKDEPLGETEKVKDESVSKIVKPLTEPAVIEHDLKALIPKDYVINDTERLNIYRRIFESADTEELETIKAELIDRFGEFLEDVENLFKLVELKIKATSLGLEKITINNGLISLQFPKDKEHSVFKSSFFQKLIEAISADKSGQYKIGGDKDTLIVDIKADSSDDNAIIGSIRAILFL